MRKRYHIGLILTLGMVLGLSSCIPDETCRKDADIYMGVTCQWNDETTADHELKHEWDTVFVRGLGKDSVIYDNAKSVKMLTLPLRADTDITAFYMRWHQIEDTLFVRHENELTYISMACGCFIYHTIDSVWSQHHFIDSVAIYETAVQDDETGHLRLYLTEYVY